LRKQQYIQLIIRLFLITINGVLIFYMYQKGYAINTIGFLLLLVFQFFVFIDYFKNQFLDIEKSIDCLLHDDYSNTISQSKRNNSLYNKTALLLEKHRKKSLQTSSEALIFTNIIESLSLGILILRKDTKNEIEVFQINNAFAQFLNIPKFYHWSLLQEKIGALKDIVQQWEKVRHTILLENNEQTESFFLKTSVTQTNEYQYLILSLETIQQLIDKKEKESWYKLMNVMSHEIINTITPISSLAENLDSLLQEETPDRDTLKELSKGLKIIKKRSYHLTSFVDTYRKLAELPLPKKEKTDLVQLVKNTLDLFEQEFLTKNISITFNNIQPVYVKVDKHQIEQVIINLLSNCLYALNDTKTPTITIAIFQENKRIRLIIEDNGIGISDSIKKNVFIPYFTTRKDGSGIGLTLSKSIIEAHNGRINFQSKVQKTTFLISF